MQPIQLSEFSRLAILERVQLLGKLRLVYMSDAPLLSGFYFDFLLQYRSLIRSRVFPTLESVDKGTEELYYRFRCCTTITDISNALTAIDNTRHASRKNLCSLVEFMEDLLTDCFAACEWTEEHQEQLTNLKPAIERHELLSFMQDMLANARILGVEKVAVVTMRITELLKSQPLDQSFTKEQINAIFGPLL